MTPHSVRRRIGLALLAGACAVAGMCASTAPHAQESAAPPPAPAVTVYSPRADSVAVTIYRDDLALITETRTVALPAAAVTLVIEDVVETLLPQSAVIADAGRPLAESNFGFDRLTPASLLKRSIGKTVTITRTNPKTGRVTQAPATIVSAGDGVVLQTADGHEALYCSGLPERLVLDEVPSELLARPRLSIRLAAGEAGERTVKVSYLAHGFAWSSDYVAHLDDGGDRMRLAGWATLVNSTGATFEQAQVQLVAGKLQILPADEGGSAAQPVSGGRDDRGSAVDAEQSAVRAQADAEVALLRDCFAAPVPVPPQGLLSQRMLARASPREFDIALAEVVVTGARIEREELGDYQLYRLPWLTDLGARQTKQVLFLDQPAVRVERFYGYRLPGFMQGPDEEVVVPDLILRTENTQKDGLGEPLPRGNVRVFEPYDGSEVFAGEAELGDRAVGLPVELKIARALNVLLEVTMSFGEGPRDRALVTAEHRVVNNKSVPVDVELRHAVESDFTDVKVEQSSRPMRKKYGDLAWRFSVPPGETVLRYRLSAREPGD